MALAEVDSCRNTRRRPELSHRGERRRSVTWVVEEARPYRTAQPDSLRHRRLRMTGTKPHAPRGTAGRGPDWDRGHFLLICSGPGRRRWAACSAPRSMRLGADYAQC